MLTITYLVYTIHMAKRMNFIELELYTCIPAAHVFSFRAAYLTYKSTGST